MTVDFNKRLTPIGDNLVCVPIDDEGVSPGGIVLPDASAGSGAEIGTVVAVGPGSMLQTGERKPMEVVVGDRVMFPKSGRIQLVAELRIAGQACWVMSEKDLYLIDRGEST